jgi:hypothetical protein
MIPIVNQILVWEKELEIRNQRRQSRSEPDVYALEAVEARQGSRRSIFGWLPRFSRKQECTCPQAACD